MKNINIKFVTKSLTIYFLITIGLVISLSILSYFLSTPKGMDSIRYLGIIDAIIVSPMGFLLYLLAEGRSREVEKRIKEIVADRENKMSFVEKLLKIEISNGLIKVLPLFHPEGQDDRISLQMQNCALILRNDGRWFYTAWPD